MILGNTKVDGPMVHVGDRRVRMSRNESKLLHALFHAHGAIVERERMQTEIGCSARSINMTMARLRDKLDGVGSDVCIETIYGIGWAIVRVNAGLVLPVTPMQIAALRTAAAVLESVNPRIAEIAWSAL